MVSENIITRKKTVRDRKREKNGGSVQKFERSGHQIDGEEEKAETHPGFSTGHSQFLER